MTAVNKHQWRRPKQQGIHVTYSHKLETYTVLKKTLTQLVTFSRN